VAPSTMTTARMVWLKERVANGDFGHAHTIKAHIGGMGPAAWKEYTGDPRVFYKKGVGPLIDLGVYMLHTITGLFGPATSVAAVGGIVYPERTLLQDRFAGEQVTVETPDVLSINLTFKENRFATLFTTYAVVGTKAPMFELFGTEGAASVAARQWYSGNGSTDFLFVTNGPSGRGAEWEEDVPTPNQLPIDGILESGILHAINVVENGGVNILSPEHATHVLEIINGALASAETGEPVTLTTTFSTP
jgi:predicted dehydrogenase